MNTYQLPVENVRVMTIAEPVDAAVDLLMLNVEMDARLRKLTSIPVRNITDYNEKCAEKMPHMIVFVKEVLDLPKLAHDSLLRLVASGRSVGIYTLVEIRNRDCVPDNLKVALGLADHFREKN